MLSPCRPLKTPQLYLSFTPLAANPEMLVSGLLSQIHVTSHHISSPILLATLALLFNIVGQIVKWATLPTLFSVGVLSVITAIMDGIIIILVVSPYTILQPAKRRKNWIVAVKVGLEVVTIGLKAREGIGGDWNVLARMACHAGARMGSLVALEEAAKAESKGHRAERGQGGKVVGDVAESKKDL